MPVILWLLGVPLYFAALFDWRRVMAKAPIIMRTLLFIAAHAGFIAAAVAAYKL